MELIDYLSGAIITGHLPVEVARRLIGLDWKSMIEPLEPPIKREVESLFYFMEGFVEEVDEGFVDGSDDPELYARSVELLRKLQND